MGESPTKRAFNSQHIPETSVTNNDDRFSVANERKICLAWQQSLHCVNCQFKSGMYKLYVEVPTGGRGQKPATTNVALHLQH